MHIKGRLLEQTSILFNCAPFHKRELLLKERIRSLGSEFFPLFGMENHLPNNVTSLEFVLISLCTCVTALPARLDSAVCEAEQKRTRWDPKDGELCLSRAKSGETLMEARSDSDVQIDRRTWV